MSHDASPGTPLSSRGVARRLAAIACLVAIAGGAHDARADAFDLAEGSWEGCTELLDVARSELGEARVEVVATLDWSDVAPEDGVLVLHPLQPMDPDETAAFMKAGGRLAILDDYGRGDETLERFRIERTGAPSRPVLMLRDKAALAIAEPVIDVVAGHSTGPHPVAARFQQLVLNHPTALRHPNLSPVLRIRAVGEPDAIVAVAGQVGKGRLFAMGDPSAVTNQMLRYPGNRAFVAGLARYLVDDDPTGHRQGRLFIVANGFREEGAFGGEATLRKTLETELRKIAEALRDARKEGFPAWLDVTVAALALLGVAWWIVQASARPYKGPLPRYARRTPLVSQGGIAGRFALLAAPSSPRSLALLELKSALFEAVAHRYDLPAEPGEAALMGLLETQRVLDDATHEGLDEVLRVMKRVEASVVAGRPAQVSKATLDRAATVVRAVLAAVGAGGASKPLVSEAPPEKNGGARASADPDDARGPLAAP